MDEVIFLWCPKLNVAYPFSPLTASFLFFVVTVWHQTQHHPVIVSNSSTIIANSYRRPNRWTLWTSPQSPTSPKASIALSRLMKNWCKQRQPMNRSRWCRSYRRWTIIRPVPYSPISHTVLMAVRESPGSRHASRAASLSTRTAAFCSWINTS